MSHSIHSILPVSQRSPNEMFRYSNYPEVATVEDSITSFIAYVETVNSAVSEYQVQEADKIYLNVSELRSMLAISYDITDVLGNAPRPCFDLIMNIRDMQESLHEILYTHLSQGNEIVSDSALVTSLMEAEEGVV